MAREPIAFHDSSRRDSYVDVCRRHPELLSLHESRHGRWALLLRAPLQPPIVDRARWLRQTRRIGSRIIADLREVGVRAPMLVLQLRAPAEVAYVLHCWPCRYDADPRQRREITELADSLAVDSRRRAVREDIRFSHAVDLAPSSSTGPVDLDARITRWYVDMTPCWRNVEPTLRRRLILRVHRWIAEAVVADGAVGLPLLEQLAFDGSLARALAEAVPAHAALSWQPWIRLVLHDLRRALSWPPSRRTEAWYRWLFLIPYSAPVPLPTREPRTPAPLSDRPAAESFRP